MNSDYKSIRLSKAAREFNLGISILVEFLHKKGYDLDPNPNTKIPQDAYILLSKEFETNPENSLSKIKVELNKPVINLNRKIDSEKSYDKTGMSSSIKEIKKPDLNIIGKIDLAKLIDNMGSSKDEKQIKNDVDIIRKKFKEIKKADFSPIRKVNLEGVKPKSETQSRKAQQYSHSSRKFDYFQPIQAIGTLKFFDYRVNKFGFIHEVKYSGKFEIDKVHVSESGLATEKHLTDGRKVIFTLNKGNRGFYATDVKDFTDLRLQDISVNLELLGMDEIVKVIEHSHPFTSEEKIVVKSLIFGKNDTNIWSLLLDLDDPIIIDEYLESINPVTLSEKIDLLQFSYHTTLLNNIISNWTNGDKLSVLNLIMAIEDEHPQDILLSKNLLNDIKTIDWTFNEIWQIYSCFKAPELINDVLLCFSFKNYGSIEVLESLTSATKMGIKVKKEIVANLIKEIDEISAETLIEIFVNLKEYQIISDEDSLLKLLSTKKLKESNIEELISLLTQDCFIDDFQKIILNNIKDIRGWKILEILNKCEDKINIAKIIIDAYCSSPEPNKKPDYLSILNHYKELENIELLNYILNNYCNQLSAEHPFEVFDLALHSENIEVQKSSFQNLTFKSEHEIISFIENNLKSKISAEVRICNKPLSGFMSLIHSKSNFKLTPDCQKFLQINKGKIQGYTIKFLIYQQYKGKISKSELKEILNTFQWTEISAILIIAFIQETNYSEKFLLNKLDAVYKKHYGILNEQAFDRQSFFENFSINNFLNMCDGRKYYDMKKWEKNGQVRWYMDGDVLHESWDSYDSRDFYCEGRPWKRENIWDAQTNKPITRKIDFYWCRNKSCAGRNDTVNLNKPFSYWTLVEITESLKIPVEKNVLANLAGWVNRINRILEHLFCRTCDEILRPLPYNPTVLGFYAVPVFNCINNNCTEYKKKIRLTHCLNGKCESHLNNEPLDSRDCKSCRPSDPNHTGLECNFCGQACPACSGHTAVKVQETW